MSDRLDVNLADKLRIALGLAKSEMAELTAMTKAYGKSLQIPFADVMKSNKARKEEIGLVASLTATTTKLTEGTQKRMRLENLINQVKQTTNDLASEQNQLMGDLVLKQVMLTESLHGSFAEQAKNYKLLLDQKALSADDYAAKIASLKLEQQANNQLQDKLDLTEEIAASILEIKEEAEGWKKSFTKVFETAKAIGRDPAVMGAFVMTQGLKKLEKAKESFEAFRKQGVSAGQAIEAQFKGMSLMSMLGLSDVKGVMNGVIEQYGSVNALSSETVSKLGTMAHHFGITGEEALKLNATLSKMPGETSATAAEAMEITGHMAELQGIAPGKIMKDMASNTAAMALYSKGGAEAFGKSAIELHKMGVEIATASKIAEGLLDFDNSINKQMEASVLLGKEINLDKARQLALSGDLEGSTAEVLKNIGGSAELEKMNVLQKKALAEATGMSVEELLKAVDAQEEHNKYFGEGAGIGATALGSIMEYGSASAGFFKENGLLLLASVQFLSTGNGLQLINNGLVAIKNGLLVTMRGLAYAISLIYDKERQQAALGWIKQKGQWLAEKAHFAWRKVQAAFGFGGGTPLVGPIDKVKGLSVDKKADKLAAGGGAGGGLKGLSKGLGKQGMGAAGVGQGVINLLGFGPAALIAVAGIPFMAAAAILGTATGNGLVGLSQGLKGKGMGAGSVMMGIGNVALFALASVVGVLGLPFLIGVSAFGWLAGIGLKGLSMGLKAMGSPQVALGVGILSLLVLSVGAGMLMFGVGVGIAAAGMSLLMTSLKDLPFENLIALPYVFMGMAAGIGAFALAGLAALPIIGALTKLAAVAPALAGLMGGSGSSSEEDKMQMIADKLDVLIAVASKGGDINMDGRKVGEIIRLGLNTSNIR